MNILCASTYRVLDRAVSRELIKFVVECTLAGDWAKATREHGVRLQIRVRVYCVLAREKGVLIAAPECDDLQHTSCSCGVCPNYELELEFV